MPFEAQKFKFDEAQFTLFFCCLCFLSCPKKPLLHARSRGFTTMHGAVCVCLFFWWLYRVACGILLLQPGIESQVAGSEVTKS